VGVVDVRKLVLSDHGGSLGELAGLELHLGVVESRDHENVVGGEDGLGEEIQDTVEDWRSKCEEGPWCIRQNTHSFHCPGR
jgi:hypothetical protein